MHDQIGTLRTRGAARDALALRGAAERALAGLALAPAALPDAAILCLRRMQLRADLQQALQGRAAREAAVQAQAQAAWVAAARPAHGPVGAANAAVWFADEAELLACLAKDLLHGQAQTWWWAALLGPVVDTAALQRRWLAQAEAAPAALRQLSAQGLAGAVLGSWPAAFCHQLAARLAALHGVPAWPPATAVGAAAAEPGGPVLPGSVDLARPASTAAWLALLAQCPGLHRLARPQQQLWALATWLAWAPAQASQAGGVAGLPAALDSLQTQPAAAGSSVASAITAGARHQQDNRAATQAKQPATAPMRLGAQNHPTGPTARGDGAAQPLAPPVAAAALLARPGPAPNRRPAAPTQASADPQTPTNLPARQAPAHPPWPASLARPARAQLSARSPHAGLVYALRLALQLGLYGDFTQPRRPGIALPPADWLALLGLRLFGPEFQQDALWPLLAAWAGRTAGQAPGQGFSAPQGQAVQPWLDAQWRGCQRLARQALPGRRLALRWLAQRPGRWALSSSRLDAHFDLAAHPLAIRQAGLDRDPGWLPAAGLAVWLHFD